MDIDIMGAGIGELTMAIALRQKAFSTFQKLRALKIKKVVGTSW